MVEALHIVILAAGQGTRMCSKTPKVLHSIAGKPMLCRVIETAQTLNPTAINVVVGYARELLFDQIDHQVNWIIQEEQLGTGHALKMALPNIPNQGYTIVLYGDVPLIKGEKLQELLTVADAASGLAILTDKVQDPTGYGRVIRDSQGQVLKIVEHKDLSAEQAEINEINTGIYAFPNQYLHQWLHELDNHNAQQEYYLTDVIAFACRDNIPVKAVPVMKSYFSMGVNDKIQLARLERFYQLDLAQQLMKQGLSLMDPNRFDVRGTLEFGQDVVIDVNVVIEGHCRLGDRVKIGANCVLNNVVIHEGAKVLPFSHLEDCEVGEEARVGPYARLRPKAKLASSAHVGNFVEVKNATIGVGSKVNHLTYIGDATIGHNSNIGAGTITCNYDGVNKHQTMIGDECRIGSGTMLVAPVKVGNKATIGAGSVITKDCPDNQLTVSRSKQVSLASWVRPEKKSN